MTGRGWTTTVVAGVLLLALAGCTEEQIADVQGAASELEGAAGRVADAASEIEGAIEDLEQGGGGQQADEGEQTPVETQAPAEPVADEGGLPVWLWVLLAALVLLLIIALATALHRRRQASEYRRRLGDDALRETDWLIDAASEQPSTVDAAPRARDVRVHTDRLTDALRRLEPESSRRVAEAIAGLHDAATALAQTTIARLDDVAAGRPPAQDPAFEDLIERTVNTRNAFEDATR